MTTTSGGTNGARQSDLAQQLTTQLAAELRELRKRSGKSLRELERPTHTSDSSLSRYLAGKALPPWQVVHVLSEQGGGDSAELHALWTRASKARARARITDPPPRHGEQGLQGRHPQETVVAPRQVPVHWLLALAALAGLVGVYASRRAIRAAAA
ncbi:helix-turn-helix transcriptional regulator [Actinomycetes bacterium KLBMP 9797]